MPPKKGQGGPKGKGKALRGKGGRPPPAALEDNGPPWAAILARLEALERSPQQPEMPQRGSGQPNAPHGGLRQPNVPQSGLQPEAPRAQSRPARANEPPAKSAHAKTQCTGNGANNTAIDAILARLDTLEAGPSRADVRTTGAASGTAPTSQTSRGSTSDGTLGRWKGMEQARILLCGHSMVFWAGRRAAKSRFGMQLGLSQWALVHWLGRRGMRWDGLLPALFQPAVERAVPQFLVIHLGE
ncbi:uncharacterized protein LOC133386070 [Rhineura floridana]|uniref:uncharacterized protein LOC133386070 n=1 Tax=Rhineura floridana TaxID=261503 RepID=UPI002AC7F465|nr:uncharacterized protein LOC133386070 [Rhineura floridana]